MSTVTQPAAVPPEAKVPEDDPYRLGWRYVTRRLPDGTVVCDQVPLTPEDVLHPEESDFIVQTDAHNGYRDYLMHVFKYRLREQEGARVLCDHRIAWDVPEVRPLGPDLMVIFHVRPGPRPATFDVAHEGVRPSLIVEITSPSTRENDLGIKVDYYYRVGIPYYVIVDMHEDETTVRPSESLGSPHAKGNPYLFVDGHVQSIAYGWNEPKGVQEWMWDWTTFYPYKLP